MVAPATEKNEIENKTPEELIRLVSERNGAYYKVGLEMLEDLEIGTYVVVYWNGDQGDSEPPQRTAEEIEIISED